MHPYFNLIVYALIMIIAVVMIAKVIQKRRIEQQPVKTRLEPVATSDFGDDGIIAVRKRERVLPIPKQASSAAATVASTAGAPAREAPAQTRHPANETASLIVMYIMAKPSKKFAGYELLQSLLTAGMRFGEMNIFHRFSDSTNNGQILFSLASATEPGTFDIHNMGAFAGKGLTMFMRKSADAHANLTRYELMLKTAHQLAEDLDGDILDEKREQLTREKVLAKKLALN